MNDLNPNSLDCWKKNLSFLKAFRPEILSLLLEKDAEFRESVHFESSDKGLIHVTFLHEGKTVSLHSKIDPLREAIRFIDQCGIEKNQNVILFGLGLGYALLELLKRREKPDWLVVIEGDLRAFWAFCHIQDSAFLFKTSGLVFLLCPSEERLFAFLQPHGFTVIANGIKLIQYPSCTRLMEKYYLSIRKKIDDFPRWAYASISTQIRVSAIFSGNFFSNLNKMSDAVPFLFFKDQFKGVPAVIVAAGPSLSKNLILLKQIQGKAVILAVDTIFKVLNYYGIEPDFVISTDFTQNAGQYFEFLKEKTSTVLLVDPEVFPGIPKNYPGPVSYYDIEGNSLCEWSRSFMGNYGILPKGLSVAHTAFSAALFMGADTVVFLGQDLSFTGGRSHVKGSAHGVNVPSESSFLEIKGWFGPIKTTNNMKVFLDHYEELISAAGKHVINCTEGGAFIKGCEHQSFRSVLLTHPFPEKKGVKEKIVQLLSAPLKSRNKSTMIEALRQAEKKLTILAEIARELFVSLEKTEKALQENNNTQVNRHFNFHERKLMELRQYEDILGMIRDNLFEAALIKAKKYKRSLNEINSPMDKEEILQILSSQRSYYQHIEKAAGIISEQIMKSTAATADPEAII